MKHIMIIGGGLQQLAAIRQAWNMGWYSIVVDGNPRALGRLEASAFYNIDIKDIAALVALARELHDEKKLDAVFTAGTDFPVSVAMVAEALSLPGIPVELAKAANNKILMRKRLQEGAMAVPAFRALPWTDETKESSLALAKEFVETYTLPVVLKPADSMGARGVRFIKHERELPEAMTAAAEFSSSQELIIEERIEGDELSIDGLVQNGKFFVCGIADRNIVFEPYRVEIGHSFPTQADSKSIDAAIHELHKAVEYFGLKTGAVKGDVFIKGERAVIGELAMRLSGGFMSGWTIPYSSGIDAVGHAMRMAAGMSLNVTDLLPDRSYNVREHAIISIPGKVVGISGNDAAWKEKTLRNIFFYPSFGDRVQIPRNNVEKVGSIIVSGNHKRELETSIHTILSHIIIQLALEDIETESFLFGKVPEISIGPKITQGRNRNFLRNIPPYDKRLKNLKKSGIPVWEIPMLADEHERDWKGDLIADIITFAKEQGYIQFVPRTKPALGSLFWQAIERGSMQAIYYCLSSLKHSVEGTLERWQSYM